MQKRKEGGPDGLSLFSLFLPVVNAQLSLQRCKIPSLGVNNHRGMLSDIVRGRSISDPRA